MQLLKKSDLMRVAGGDCEGENLAGAAVQGGTPAQVAETFAAVFAMISSGIGIPYGILPQSAGFFAAFSATECAMNANFCVTLTINFSNYSNDAGDFSVDAAGVDAYFGDGGVFGDGGMAGLGDGGMSGFGDGGISIGAEGVGAMGGEGGC